MIHAIEPWIAPVTLFSIILTLTLVIRRNSKHKTSQKNVDADKIRNR